MPRQPAGAPARCADAPPPPWVLAVAGAVVVASVTLCVLIAEDLLEGGGLISHDQAVLGWFVVHRSDRLVAAARFLSTVAGFVGLLVLAVVVGLVLWARAVHSVLVAAPTVALVVTGAIASLAKVVFGRPRPPVQLHAVRVGLDAFPSSHAADAAGCLLAIALTIVVTVVARRAVRVAVLVGAVAVAGLIGLSRLVLAVHWLSDVVAGWALGTATAVTVVVVLWWLSSRVRR